MGDVAAHPGTVRILAMRWKPHDRVATVPDAFRVLHVDKLATSYQILIASLTAHSPVG